MQNNYPSVLIIEDNEEIRESTAEILQLSDYEVFTAKDGKSGVSMAIELEPDIILCDIMMPELDGYGVLYLLSKNKKTKDIPFIFLTAKAERTDIRKAMEMGADDYLTKPFDDIELLNAIEIRLKKRSEQESIQKQAFDFFSEEDEEEILKHILEKSRTRIYRRRQSIYHAGDQPYFLMYVLEGKVRAYLYHDDGREFISNIYRSGDFFGHESIFGRETYNYSVETFEDTKIAQISRDDFLELMQTHSSIARKFISLMSREIIQKNLQLSNLAYDSVRKKVANALILMAQKTISSPEVDDCLVRVSRDNLSALAGTANETISRMLSDFINEGLISKEGNAIRIHSIKNLKEIKQ